MTALDEIEQIREELADDELRGLMSCDDCRTLLAALDAEKARVKELEERLHATENRLDDYKASFERYVQLLASRPSWLCR